MWYKLMIKELRQINYGLVRTKLWYISDKLATNYGEKNCDRLVMD